MADEIGLKARSNTAVIDAESPAPEDLDPTLPRLAGPRAPQAEPEAMSVVRTLDEPLWRARVWIRVLGGLSILYGLLIVVNLWGLLFCWLPIWLGRTLIVAARQVERAAAQDDPEALRGALGKIALYFKILGVSAAVGLLAIVVFAVAVTLGLAGSAAVLQRVAPTFTSVP